MDKRVLLVNHLSGELSGKDVNLSLQLQGRTLYYFARWSVLSKKHRLICTEEPVPNKPMLRLLPADSTQPSVYELAGFNP